MGVKVCYGGDVYLQLAGQPEREDLDQLIELLQKMTGGNVTVRSSYIQGGSFCLQISQQRSFVDLPPG